MTNSNHLAKLEEVGVGEKIQDALCRLLETCILFKDFTHQELAQIMKYVHVYDAPKGAILFQEGEKDSYLMIVVSGKASIFKKSDSGENKQIASVLRGSLLGEMTVIDDFPHSATVITSDKSQIALLTKNNLIKITEDYPALGIKLLWKLAWQLSSRLRQASGLLVDHIE